MTLTHFLIPFHGAPHFTKPAAFPQRPWAQSPCEAARPETRSPGVLVSASRYSILRRRHVGHVPHPRLSCVWSWRLKGKASFLRVGPLRVGHQGWCRPGRAVKSAGLVASWKAHIPCREETASAQVQPIIMQEVILRLFRFFTRNWKSSLHVKFSDFCLLAHLIKSNEIAYLQACSICPSFCRSLGLKHLRNTF